MEYVHSLRKKVGNTPLILPGAVVLILNEKHELLLQHRTDGGWGLPGGLMELGESMEETARREVEEETGLLINDLKLLGLFSGAEYHFTFDNGDEIYSVTAVYQTSTYSGKIVPNKDESLDVRFFAELPPELLPEYRTYIEPYYIPKKPK
ncbi:8-oxo-dGTP pyrophosphatase MutT (NUDIX family) [Alkalihalobacillus xiaoxiensis]|uniref:8-oxo-dGTP pyrophosphatase MutT (NUDIX family) n=1 Tax=Shouchella xiaoxiensis TaxID=766895 RepID=A0ABS2T0L9_9BACI|nr:NUDIX hydrolase [Shouchella xiaoxiensis]MBM7840027.1 8-oxo-dGTP pyrophosphatase MutT (NUDIX family) [Shouchella xiaoxiensis]